MSQTIPTTINNRQKINNPPPETAADYLLTHNAITKETGSISKTILLKPLQKQIDEITNPDGFLKIGNVNQVGNTLSILALEFEWKIKPVLFFTNEFFSTVIAPATDRYNRIDAIVANDFGGFTKIQGNESLTAAIQPNRPNNSLPVTFITVFGANIVAIAPPTEPVLTLQEIRETVNDLMNLKVDKAEGERLINASEIDKLADQSGTNTGDEVLATDAVSGIVKTDVTVADPVVYLKETTDELLKGKANYFLAVKPITGISYNVIIDDILNELLYDGTLPMNVIIPNNATVPFPVGTIFYTLGTNTGILSASGGAGVVLKVKTGISLSAIQNEVRQYTKIAVNTWSVRGDLNLGAVTQTELSYLQGATSNIQAQINAKTTLSGTPNFLMKFLTASTATISRLFDNGNFLGIGTVNAPTKDVTLGNQANREIGIEQSENTVKGRDLKIRAGRTVNFLLNTGFVALNQPIRAYTAVAVNSITKDVYLAGATTDVYKQTAGAGAFVSLGFFPNAVSIAVKESSGDVYIADINGFIHKQTGGIGAFVNIAPSSKTWRDVSVNQVNGDVFICAYGFIFKQTGGTGAFIDVGATNRNYNGIAVNSSNGDIHVSENYGDVFKQTGGTGVFVGAGLASAFKTIKVNSVTNDVYVCDYSNILKQTGGTGVFVNVAPVGLYNWVCLSIDTQTSNVYAVQQNTDLYKQTNYAVGAPNLDGGALQHIAGTGKGTGKSRYEIWTGQKTVSGTDMQIETLREYIDENGYHIYTSIPVYADNAAAIAAGLPVGCEYRTGTGIKMIVY